MCIVTGPNIDIAIKLIKRMKNIFESKLHINFHDKETVLELIGCRIEAFPSNHIDSFIALDNPKFILLDESGPSPVAFLTDRCLSLKLPSLINSES